MSKTTHIIGSEELQNRLGELFYEYGQPISDVVVGFITNYALYVHEDMVANHPVGQAKYLEQPARELSAEMGRVVAEALESGIDPTRALVMAGMRLQREAQKLVPVDTGNLKGSAFTAVE
jgi:hypothetical protein